MRHTYRLLLRCAMVSGLNYGCGAAIAQIDGGLFSTTGGDVYPRYFHAAGMLEHGPVMVSGGLNISFIPPTLISRPQISFYQPATGTFSAQFSPLNGGAPTTSQLSDARSSHTQSTLPDGRVLIAGGHRNASGTSPGTAFTGVEIFDPWTGTVSAGPPMAAARAMHTATALADGRVVVAGGASWQIFDWVSNTWSANYGLARTRTAHTAVLLEDYEGIAGNPRVLLIGGAGSGPTTCELLDPASGTTALLTAALRVGVDDLSAIALPDGRVFVAGGQNLVTGDTVANADIIDPENDTINAMMDLPNRAGGAADQQIVRSGWHVVLLGGEQQAAGVDTVLNYAAVFDAAAGEWLDDGAMLSVHDDFAAVALSRCRTLIIGGGVPFLGQEIPSSACEILELTDATLCLPGDVDNDGDVDLADQARFTDCCAGPTAESDAAPCIDADLDGDGDVDLLDFAVLQRAGGGP
jgi:hypothetical protein